jgi:hypothetical protein
MMYISNDTSAQLTQIGLWYDSLEAWEQEALFDYLCTKIKKVLNVSVTKNLVEGNQTSMKSEAECLLGRPPGSW